MSNITMSRPAGAAILRKLTNPLYDSTVLQGGVAINNMQFFRLPIGANMPVTAVAKTEADTNLTQAGQMGTPQMFDLEGFCFEHLMNDATSGTITDAQNIANVEALYGQAVYNFFFGQQRPWLQLPLRQIPTGPFLTGDAGMGDVGNADMCIYLGMGKATVDSIYNFTVGKKAIRVHSAEPFNATVTYPNAAITPTAGLNYRMRTYMIGSLYAAL